MLAIPGVGENKHTNTPDPLIIPQHKRKKGRSMKILPCYSRDINEFFWSRIPQKLLIRIVTMALFPAYLIS